MRRINGKLFLALLLGGITLTAGVFVVHTFQYHRIGRALLYQARRAEEQAQPARSARYLARYLEFNPGDLTEKANLARTWASDAFAPTSRARLEAVKIMDQVLLGEDDPELRRLLVKTAVGLHDYKLARDHLTRLLGWQEVENWIGEDRAFRTRNKPLADFMAKVNPQRGELEGYWGLIQEADKKPAEAIACYRLALRHAPALHQNYVRLAYLLRRQNETDPIQRKQNHQDADLAIDDMVKSNPESSDSYLARWRYRRDFDLLAVRETSNRGQVELDAAAEDVVQALKRRPEAIDGLLAAADLERLRGRAAAEDANRSPQQRREALKEHRTRALDHLRRGLDLVAAKKASGTDHAEFQLLWHKGNLLLDDLDLQRAQRQEDGQPAADDPALKQQITTVLEQMRKTQMPAAADYMRGRLLVNERQWSEAAALFERSRAQMSSQPDLACQANLYLGQCYEKLEEHAQMFNAFKRVADWDPTSVPAMIGMAAARWAQGQLDQALAQYDLVMKQRQVPPRGWIDITRLEIQRQIQRPTPDWKDAEKALANAEKYFTPDYLDVVLLRAELLLRQNRADETQRLLEAARDRNPREVEYWTALSDLAVRQNSPARARAILDEAARQLKDPVSLRIARGRYLAAAGGKNATKEIAKLAEGASGASAEDQAKLLSGIADLLYRQGDAAGATKLWQTLATLPRHKTDLRLRLLLFDLAMKDNDDARMRATLADIRAVEGDGGSYHRYGQALHLIWQARKDSAAETRTRQLQQARQSLDAVLTQRPSWPPVFLARAEIAELNGNPEQAIKDLQEAIKNGENSPGVIRRLVALLTQRGRDGEAQFLLAKLQQSVLYNTDLGKLAVVVALRRGEEGQAIEMMRRAVREDSRDAKDLVWMSQVLATARRTGEAEKMLRQAVQSAEADPLPRVALVQFLMSQQRRDEALLVIEQAAKKLQAEKKDLALARCNDLVGNVSEALVLYRRAYEAGKQDAVTVKTIASAHLAANRPREAEPLLRRFTRGELRDTPAADVAWARRALAMVLASGTDYQRFSEALQLVGLKLDGSGRLAREPGDDESTENRRARARVLASQNQKQFRERAIEVLEDLARARALTPEDEFVLALLYESEGQTRKSQEKLKVLVQPQTRTAQYLAQYAMSLITQRRLPSDLDEAEKLLGWLEELEQQRRSGANSFASVELRARLLEARGKGDEALALLQRHLSREEARPEEVLLVLASLSRQKRYKEAYDLCEQTWQAGKVMPEAVGGVSVALLRVMNPTDSQVAAVEKHLQGAIAKKADSTVLLMHLSDLCDKRGQYDRAADLYRQVLRREPNNVVALNNLAWLLAQRAGDAGTALEHINKAVAGMGRRADLLDTRGVVHLARKDAASAVADLKEASTESPTPTRLFHLALAHHENRDAARAREVLRAACDKGLQVTSLHPIEQDRARSILQEYGMR